MVACKKESDLKPSSNPQVDPLEVTSGAPGAVIILTGSGLADMKSIIFETDMVPAPFNPAFNNNNAVVFRVPDTASAGQQDIILTNSLDKEVRVSFNVTPLPSVSTVSDYNFIPGETEIILSGNYLNDVDQVVLSGTEIAVTIVSKSQRQMVVSFPETDLPRVKLDISSNAGEVTTAQEFVNVNEAFKIFTDTYENGFENASWGPAGVDNAIFKAGAASFRMTYGMGNWSANGFANWGAGMNYNPDYTFLTFWIRGGSQDYVLYLTGDQRVGGYGNADRSVPVNVPANVWTYVKLSLSDLDLWSNGDNFKQLGLWIAGPDAQDETMYLDDVLFIK